jgi:hypothetical protein
MNYFKENNTMVRKDCYIKVVSTTGISFQLYLCIKDNINVGDYFLTDDFETHEQIVIKSAYKYGSLDMYDKVVASTNSKLILPNLPKHLIQYYEKHGNIDGVGIEFWNYNNAPVINNGEIVVSSYPPKTYTQEEVKELLNKCWSDAKNTTHTEIKRSNECPDCYYIEIKDSQTIEHWLEYNL